MAAQHDVAIVGAGLAGRARAQCVSGDHRATASLQDATVSGRRTARELLATA